LFQARGANHAVIMLGDAFPAEKAAAFRAARHGFARGMIETSLVSEAGHAEDGD
jgi:hypothetical protein